MRIIELKIKIMSLAAEASIIHREENKHRSAARAYERFARDPDGAVRAARRDLEKTDEGTPCPRDYKASRHVLRIANTPMTMEKAAGNAPKHRATFQSLRGHRKGAVRETARQALLAYACLQGRPYATVEAPNSCAPEWDGVKDTVLRFGGTAEAWSAWAREASEHLAGQVAQAKVAVQG